MFTFGCVCGHVMCDTHLKMDLQGEPREDGRVVRGMAIIEENGSMGTMVIPEWLAQAIEDAIISHQQEKR